MKKRFQYKDENNLRKGFFFQRPIESLVRNGHCKGAGVLAQGLPPPHGDGTTHIKYSLARRAQLEGGRGGCQFKIQVRGATAMDQRMDPCGDSNID